MLLVNATGTSALIRKVGKVFIVLEGADGVGKSTQVKMLSDNLTGMGIEHIVTREPGGTEIGAEIRELLFSGKYSYDYKTELFLFLADRAAHYQQVVAPAIQAGVLVIQDRYIDSTIVYQGIVHQLGTQQVSQMSVWATDLLMPDLTITIDAEQSFREVPQDKFHELNVENWHRIRKLYKTLAGSPALTSNMLRGIVDGNRDRVLVADEILHLVLARIDMAKID